MGHKLEGLPQSCLQSINYRRFCVPGTPQKCDTHISHGPFSDPRNSSPAPKQPESPSTCHTHTVLCGCSRLSPRLSPLHGRHTPCTLHGAPSHQVLSSLGKFFAVSVHRVVLPPAGTTHLRWRGTLPMDSTTDELVRVSQSDVGKASGVRSAVAPVSSESALRLSRKFISRDGLFVCIYMSCGICGMWYAQSPEQKLPSPTACKFSWRAHCTSRPGFLIRSVRGRPMPHHATHEARNS